MVERPTHIRLVTICIFVATFMTAIEGTIVSTAMPTIVGSLNGMSIMNWVFSIYLLTNAMMTPVYGKLADQIGRKPIFLLGVFLFILGSFLCSLTQTMVQLIVARAIQGTGAGAISPVALTILADIYPFEKRARVMGFNNAAWGIASVVGPLCGGIIVEVLSWHWIFLINVPIGIGLMIMISLFLVEPKRKRSKDKLDISGSILLMLLLLSLLYGFQLLGEQNHFTSSVGIAFMLAVALLGLFLQVEKKASDPVISLHLFHNRMFVLVNLIAALVSGFLIGVDVYMPMWMQGILGLKAAKGGLVISPLSITWVFGSFVASWAIQHYPIKRNLQLGLLIIFIGVTFLALAPMRTPFFLFMLVSTILGLGLGIVITTTTVVAQQSVQQDQLGVATSFNTLVRTLGQTVMIAVFGVVLNSHIEQEISRQPKIAPEKNITTDMMNQLVNPLTADKLPQTMADLLRSILYSGLHRVYFVGGILLVIALLTSLFLKNGSIKKKKSKTLDY